MMNDWNTSADVNAPARNPSGQNLGVDDVQLHRTSPRTVEAMAQLERAIDVIKARPVETFVLPNAVVVWMGFMAIFAQIAIPAASSVLITGSAMFAFVQENLALAASMGTILGTIAAVIASQIFCAAVAVILSSFFWLQAVRDQDMKLAHFGAFKSSIIPLAIGMTLYCLGVSVGSLALLVPGCVLSIGWMFWFMIILDKNLGAVDALRASWRLTRGHRFKLLGLCALAAAANGAGFLFCLVGLLFTVPLTIGAVVCYYDALAQPGNAYLD